jgi:hypothetical protein
MKKTNEVFELFEVVRDPFQFHHQRCILNDASQYLAKVGDVTLPIGGPVLKYCRPDERRFSRHFIK